MLDGNVGASKPNIVVVKELLNRCLAWVHNAELAGIDKLIGSSEAREFRAWLEVLSSHDLHEVRSILIDGLTRGISSAVRYCASSSSASTAVPVGYMNYVDSEHLLSFPNLFHFMTKAPDSKYWVRHHQLLGHAPTSQSIGRRTDKEVLLLHLVSDSGVDFMFGDGGELQFWIDIDDLIARRFDRVRVNPQGS